MSLPSFSTQSYLFSTAGLSAQLFPEDDRYFLFAKLVYPELAAARPKLEACYCLEEGRPAVEPVLMLGVSVLQYLEDVPDRQAVDLLHYHYGWMFALNRQPGDPLFHATTLVNFRQRLDEHGLSEVGFQTILDALVKAGLISRQSRQRLDSTQMFGRVSRMSRLDCVRESLRLALKELEPLLELPSRPCWWTAQWEKYVESQVDYRASSEALARKLAEAGQDAWQLLDWLRQPAQSSLASNPQAQLLQRVFGEQFEVVASQPAPRTQEKQPIEVATAQSSPAQESRSEVVAANSESVCPSGTPLATEQSGPVNSAPVQAPTEDPGAAAQVLPKDKKQMDSQRVRNPHDPEASYASKGQGEQKKEHVGYKVQVAESVSEAVLAPGEPTHNFLMGMVSHPAYESDEAGAKQMEAEQAAMGLEKPPVQYVDGAYVSAQELATAAAEGRELIGPAPGAPDNNEGRFTTEQFQVSVEERKAVCPAGQQSTQCSRLHEAETGKVTFRFEWSTHCADCPLRGQCVSPKQKHRTIVVGEHHSALQTRRREQQSSEFKERMKHRNGIEGTQSELVRGHGLRRARYRGLAKVKLQNYFIGAACNVKRWLRLEAWKIRRALSGAAAPAMAPALD